jgi:hypothetical protein
MSAQAETRTQERLEGETDGAAPPAVRLSIVMEWANTRLYGESRAALVLERTARQWGEVAARSFPATLAPEEAAFLARLAPRAELVIASGEERGPDLDPALRERVEGVMDLDLVVAPGLEYYPLKNRGARDIRGDIFLFVDADVLPEEGWLAHLLATFARREVEVAVGQTLIAPTDLAARAFALGWMFPLPPDAREGIRPAGKFFANNIAFRAGLFRRVGFPAIGARSRGSCSILREALDRMGVRVFSNPRARVQHPPPTGLRRAVVRALAHGRDHYMKGEEGRSLRGLRCSLGEAAGRFGRGASAALRRGHEVGLAPREVPAAIAILAGYYAVFAAGGVLTHVSPEAMAGRFRI